MHWAGVCVSQKRSLEQGNVFIGVCQSFCSQDGEGVLCPGRGSPRHRPPDRDPPWTDPPIRQRVGSTHPAGMHSCLAIAIAYLELAGNNYWEDNTNIMEIFFF